MIQEKHTRPDRRYYVKFHMFPLALLILILLVTGILLANQRANELEGIRERLRLQTNLLAEKISSKLNTYEMSLMLMESEYHTRGKEDPLIGKVLQRQLLLHEEVEGVCLINADGTIVFSSYFNKSESLEEVKSSILDTHLIQGIPFALSSFTDHDAKHLAISRSLFSFDGGVEAIVLMVVETHRFFGQLDLSTIPGLTSAVLYDSGGEVFALWYDQQQVGFVPNPDSVQYVEQLEDYGPDLASLSESELQGGSRVFMVKDSMIALSQTPNFPMTLGMRVQTYSAMAAFDRSVVISVTIIVMLIAIAWLLYDRLIKQTKANDQLHMRMVDDLSVQVQRRTAELEHLLGRDSLTGIMNRHLCNEEMEKAIHRHDAADIPFSTIMVDIDGFKQVNDTHGHLMGDNILVHITDTIVQSLGEHNIVARWGGDELLILLPHTSLQQAITLAENTCEAVEHNPYRNDIHCTISLGVAEHHKGETATALIHRADEAMYKAKSAGKNRAMGSE